jgi:glycosyltransferase involved in cell wall biosynthesis
MRISAVLLARDEADRIARAIESVAFLDEVLVVDSGSKDGTPDLARAKGARVVETDWPGYGAQRNRAAGLAANDWVLMVDADERVDDALKAALERLRAGPEPTASAFALRRTVFALGRWIRHGGWGRERRLRLYDRRRARWAGEVHEWLEVEGGEGPDLEGLLEHRPFRSLLDHWQRLGRYAELAAQMMYAKGRRASWFDLRLRPVGRFVKMYLLRLGILDGWAGFTLARLESAYVLAKYARLRELGLAPRAGRP